MLDCTSSILNCENEQMKDTHSILHFCCECAATVNTAKMNMPSDTVQMKGNFIDGDSDVSISLEEG